VFTTLDKAALVRQYQEARSQGKGEGGKWLEANDLTRDLLNRWRQKLASSPSRYGNPEPSRAVLDYLDLPEIGPVEAFALDDLLLTRRSYAREEKLALLTEYAHLGQDQTGQWLHDRHLTASQMSRWRRAWREGLPGEGDPPPTPRPPRRVLTTQEKAALVWQYEEAKSQGPGGAKRWLEANNLTRRRLSFWRRRLASRQDPAPLPSGHGNPGPGRAVSDYLDLPEIGAVEAYTLDDLPLTRRSHTPQQRFALVTEYAQLKRGTTRRWLRDHDLTTTHMSRWRRAGEQGRLGEGDLPPAARPPRRVFTLPEKVALVRQYRKSQGRGGGRRWLAANNLTREQVDRWRQELARRQELPSRQELASRQDPASPPSGHDNPEPSRAVPDYLDLPEIGPVEASTLADLPLTRRRYTPQEKLALLTEYAGLERGQAGQWLNDHHLSSSHMLMWRRAGEEGQLGEGDLPPAARASRRTFTRREKASLVRQYQEVRSQGRGDGGRWLEANNLLREQLSRWRRQLASLQDPAPALSGQGTPELTMDEVDPAGGEGLPPDARFPPVNTSMDGAEPSGANEDLVDPMDSWWATTLASATSPLAAWGDWNQGNNGQGTAEPDRQEGGSSSPWWGF
jgi:transposase-like protein